MAKDAGGHGSEQHGGGSFDNINAQRKAQGFKPMAEKKRGMYEMFDYLAGDGPKPAFVAQVLAGGHPKAAPVDTHPAMSAADRFHGSIDHQVAREQYNRDLALRIRDKQVGSGMKHR